MTLSLVSTKWVRMVEFPVPNQTVCFGTQSLMQMYAGHLLEGSSLAGSTMRKWDKSLVLVVVFSKSHTEGLGQRKAYGA